MSRALLLLGFVGGLMWPKKVTDPGTPPKMKFPVTDSLNLTVDQRETSLQIERGLRHYGFSDELITGAIVNAYAESDLDKTAVGRAGERGVFQLNPRGLGKKMSAEQMHDIMTSTHKIAGAVKNNKRLMKFEAAGADAETLTAIFCEEIERPKNKRMKGRQRAKLVKKISRS